jgi:anaerobic selenocysteine-containing dehydrogenase
VAIDPIRTRSAKAADEHISLRPGTDVILAAGIARVLIAEDLVDLDAAAAVAEDLADDKRTVQPWTPDLVEAATDVPAETVIRIAREFAAARPAVIRSGVGVQQSANGEAVVRAQSALAILGGHWRLPGGGLFIETGPDLDEIAASRPDLATTPSRKLDLARIGEHLTSDTLDPPVMALVVWGMNPAVTQPDAGLVQRGLARDDLFTVVLEQFMTDTARFADIVLPSTTQLEHFDVVGSWGHHYISANEPAIAPLGASLSHGEIARRLARRLGLSDPALFETDEEIAASALPSGLTLEMVRERGWLKRSPAPAGYGDGRTVRIDAPISAPAPREGGVLQLLTPKSHYFLNTTFANMPRQRTAMQRPTLDMHPADADDRGLTDGDAVTVTDDRHTLQVWLRVNDDIHPGVVALPGKWWGTPQATSAVANLLSPSSYTPHGQPAYNDTYVRVQRASV